MTDYISRADAIDAVKKRLYETAMNNMEHGDIYADIAENRIDIWLSALPSADAVPQLRQTDTLIIADALRYLIQDTERHELDRTIAEELREQILQYGASMCKGGDDE